MSDAVKSVGLIGLGNAGGPMAQRLLLAGCALKVFDLSRERMREAARLGAVEAKSAADAASEITVVLLPSDLEVRAAVYREGGVLMGIKPGNILIDLSGTDPDCARELEEKVSALGGFFVGGTVHAAGAPAVTIPAGNISLVVGGKKRALDDSIELLQRLARKIICVPEPWMPKSMKLAIIMLAAIEGAATAEIMAWLLGQNLDPRLFREVIHATGSTSLQRVEEFFRRGERTGGTLSNIRKDLRQSLSVARDRQVPLLMTSLAQQLAEMAVRRSGDRVRPSAAFATLYEALAHVDMSQSSASTTAMGTAAPAEARVIYVGNF
ncbi:MAG: NAD(P)-dependent oxidoreductase, partial [Deltaproteobacteria bacterium]|nr:NAD(P)-dependent oxidoreductase [Deltaproteobacteria bacterium]